MEYQDKFMFKLTSSQNTKRGKRICVPLIDLNDVHVDGGEGNLLISIKHKILAAEVRMCRLVGEKVLVRSQRGGDCVSAPI